MGWNGCYAVSQVEHGLLRLVNSDSTRITVVVDCQGLSPYRIPMQIMRSCLSLLQDHFPGRLGCVFVIRLPPVLRVIAQTLLQVMLTYYRVSLAPSFLLYYSGSILDTSETCSSKSLSLSGSETCYSREAEDSREHLSEGSCRVSSDTPIVSWWKLQLHKL